MRTTVIALALLTAWPAGAATLEEGRNALRQGRPDQAETMLREVTLAEPENAAAHEALAESLAAMKKHEEATREIDRASELGLAEDRVNAVRARNALELRDLESLEKYSAAALEANPENADALRYRGMVATQRKDFAAGVKDLEKSLEFDAEHPYTHYYLGLAYNGVKRPDKMIEHLRTFVMLAPDAPEADKVRSLMRGFR